VGLGLSVIAMLVPTAGLRVVHPFDALAGIALGFGILYGLDRIAILILKKPGMGFGDVKLMAMLGAFIGWQGVLGTLMLASILGSTIGLSMILYFKMKGAPEAAEATPDVEAGEGTSEKDDESDDGISLGAHYLPFGPYIAIAGLVYLFVGPELIAWYLQQLAPIA
jgi:leader peptidase (prepilin peptidase)/N-methyltransferase